MRACVRVSSGPARLAVLTVNWLNLTVPLGFQCPFHPAPLLSPHPLLRTSFNVAFFFFSFFFFNHSNIEHGP